MKKKLVLDLDAIEVTSFDTGGASVARGTVQANGASRQAGCANTVVELTCELTCDPSCGVPCPTQDPSCPESCGCATWEASCIG